MEADTWWEDTATDADLYPVDAHTLVGGCGLLDSTTDD